MSLHSYLNTLKKKDKIIDTLLHYTSIKPSIDYPFQNYIGINYTDKSISSLKFYFAFYEPITKEVSHIFLDTYKEFDEYKHLWVSTKNRGIENTGLTFTLKLSDKFEITKGFHFRFPYSELIHFPETKQFKLIPDDLMNVGINFEYTDIETKPKYYYYFYKEHNRQKFAVKYNQPFISGASLIEYTESDKFNKIIAWDVSDNSFYQTFQKDNEWAIQKEIRSFIAEKANYHHKSFHGFYDNNKVRSMYFMNYKPDKSVAFPGSSEINFQVFTIKDFMEKFL